MTAYGADIKNLERVVNLGDVLGGPDFVGEEGHY